MVRVLDDLPRFPEPRSNQGVVMERLETEERSLIYAERLAVEEERQVIDPEHKPAFADLGLVTEYVVTQMHGGRVAFKGERGFLVEDLPHEVYLRREGLSASRLGILKRSAAHLLAALEQPTKTTDEMVLGSAIHCAVLEPQLFDSRVVVMPEFNLRSPSGREARDAFLAQHRDEIVISSKDLETVRRCADALHLNPDVRTILDVATYREVSGFWLDAETGVPCKLRADIVSTSLSLCADLKSTRDASEAGFTRSILNFRYHSQAAWYLEGFAALGLPLESFVFIAFEKEPPYATATYRLDDEALEIGRRENRMLVTDFEACKRENRWPGYPTGIRTISLPEWRLRQEQYA